MEDCEVARQEFEQKVDRFLASAYTSEGARKWWTRRRYWLYGRSPQEILNDDNFSSDGLLEREVLWHARALAGPGSAT